MKQNSALWVTVTALFTAMTVILSMSIFSIPVPGGHLYFCDTVINTAAVLLDPLSAMIVGGIGSFLGDMLFYPAPMFVSLVVHGLQGLIVSLLSRKIRLRHRALSSGIAMSVGAVIMTIGYTLGRAYVYATPEVAAVKLPFEILQGIFGVAVAMALLYPLRLEERFHQILH